MAYNKAYNEAYIGAPYNFVPFASNTIKYKEERPAHDSLDEDLISGEIIYKITAKTPIIIDNGNGKFYKNANGKFAIPGSSIRGMIRSNAQILSFSDFSNDIDDYALMYRNVASGSPKKRYGDILGNKTVNVTGKDGNNHSLSVLTHVRAGYVINKNGEYYIYDTKLDHVPQEGFKEESEKWNYYILSERHLAEVYCDMKKKGKEKDYPYSFFVEKGHIFKTIHRLDIRFEKGKNEWGKTIYTGRPNKRNGKSLYKPYVKPCSYNVKGRNVTAVSADVDKLEHKGYVISSGEMNMKKAIYIIPEIDRQKQTETYPIKIPDSDLKAFQIDINKRESNLKTKGGRAFFDLPKEKEMKPIFYIQLGGKLYFGFTPRLRLFYDHTVKEGLPAWMKKEEKSYGYADMLFGYSTEEESYKSRVSFMDAVVLKENCKEEQECNAILAEPKPTSYLDYLVQKKRGTTYNNEKFELRGVKQYWLRDEINEKEKVEDDKKDKDYVSCFTPLKKNTVFEGKVRFHNLRKEELGLLLWSMKPCKKAWMNIGKGKPLGYGTIELEIISAKKQDDLRAYDLSNFTLDPFEDIDVNTFINAYKSCIRKEIKEQPGKPLEEIEPIKSFIAMKSSDKLLDSEKIRYMSIDKPKKDYQNRRGEPLKTVAKMIEEKTKKK